MSVTISAPPRRHPPRSSPLIAGPTVLTPCSAGSPMTPEEFDAAEVEPDNGLIYELIDGRVIVMPPPSERERDPNDELGYLLRHDQRQHPRGDAMDKTLPESYVPHAFQRRRCDRAVWCGYGRPIDVREDVPSIAVEFVSEGRRSHTRDYEEKREEYFNEADVKEYWIFNRFERTLTVYRGVLDPDDPEANETVVRGDEAYSTPLLPGFEVSPAAVFAVLDMLTGED